MRSDFYKLPFALSLVCTAIFGTVAMAEEDDFDLVGEMSLQDLFAIDTDIASV